MEFSYLRVQRTTFKVSDFLAWAQSGRLELNPYYQRRSVWKQPAKSLLIDTIMRGLPVPIIIIRDRFNLKTKLTTREVVDGQQRIRTVLTYLGFDPNGNLKIQNSSDWQPFNVLKAHNKTLSRANTFDSLPESQQRRFLDYEFPAHVLPHDIDDGTILNIFTRLNSTGVKLSTGELRNAKFHGPFATLVKDLAITNVHRWRDWGVLKDTEISRMVEIDLVADLCITAAKGDIYANRSVKMDEFYDLLEEESEWELANVMRERFDAVIEQLNRIFDDDLKNGIFARRIMFWALWTVVYDKMYGLNTPLICSQKPSRLPTDVSPKLHKIQKRFYEKETLPTEVVEAISKGSTDLARRKVRFEFLKSSLDW